LNTEVVDGFGTNLLQRLVLRDTLTGEREEVEASALFILIGGAPRTDWLPPALERDGDGFIYTGSDLEQVDHRWPVNRAPLPMETSMPGVFAAGDVRHGSMKRVASAVGEGASVIRHIHEFLRRA
jgi:thioredoxin reductase (NADPH)